MTLKTLRNQINANIAIFHDETMKRPIIVSSRMKTRYDDKQVIKLFLYMSNIIGIEVD